MLQASQTITSSSKPRAFSSPLIFFASSIIIKRVLKVSYCFFDFQKYRCRTNNTCLPRAAGAQEVTMQDQNGVLVEAIRVTVSELHEIWHVEGKQCSLRLGVANFIHIHEPTHYPPYLVKS